MPIQTYTEIINPKEAEYVSTLSYEDFFKCFPEEVNGNDGEWNLDDKKEYFKLVKKYIYTQIKNNFKLEINYKPSDKNPTGRIYAKCPMALQRIHKPLREFLTKGLYQDYDMINCHFVIFKHLCEGENLSTFWINNYIQNRTKILEDNKANKSHILAKLNSDNARCSAEWNKELKGLIKECNNNKKVLYKKFIDDFEKTNKKNPISSIINKKMCEIENNILQQVITEFPDNYIVPCFDGFLINEPLEVNSLPDEICKWTEKPIQTNVVVPDDFTFVAEAEVVKEQEYESMKELFEERHAKILNKSMFVMRADDELIFKTKADLIISYEHLNFKKWSDSEQKYKKTCFIKEWFKDETIKTYDDVSCYPDANFCPPNIFNTWTGFAVEKLEPCKINDEYVEVFKKHILILCDNDEEQQKILLWWMAHIFQYPDYKSFNPVLISAEGAGKGTLLKIISRLCGRSKVLETADPLEYVFGRFNDMMTDAIVVNINECCKKDMIQVVEKLKELVTDPTLCIQGKGIKKFSMPSYHRFITTTNNEDPIPTKDGDRRNHIIRASDELKGNIQYFTHINKLIETDEFIYSVYQYLLSLPDVPRKFIVEQFPQTEYQEELKEAAKDYALLWLEAFVGENIEDENIVNKTEYILNSRDVYESFKTFCDENGFKCERNTISFMKHLNLMKIQGITKRKSNGMRMTCFDLKLLAKNLLIGCQL